MVLYATLGTMKSGKTKALVKKQKELVENGQRTIVVVPDVSKSRDIGSVGKLQSRDGTWTMINYYISTDQDISTLFTYDSVLLVDEIQFFTIENIFQIYKLSLEIDVYVYGLELDFNGNEFESAREIKRLCHFFENLHATCEVCFKNKAVQDCLVNDNEDKINATYKSKCNTCIFEITIFE